MKRGRHSRTVRERPERHRRSLRPAGEKLELDDAEIEELDRALARRTLELEA